MPYRIIAFAIFILLVGISLSLKIYRYTVEISAPKHLILEEQLVDSIKKKGWGLKLKEPMNTNESSFVYMLEHKHCPQGVFVSILGQDASDRHLLSQYMRNNNIIFLLDGKQIDHFMMLRFYMMTVYVNVMRLFDESKPLPLALSVYIPAESKECRYFFNI
ncbi:hypothetical protein ABT56_02140 [Photobacterium aquae]|uniref:Uncharacterized protein n=1 Tax=Photobacterium aquae TaxID=1195763 RepID=A0A0J1HBK1_9GAMM|nr:hypothetical protein [Photobacterium aquae]KLV09025.1 hypothetical protein ABT56_02140 [Photobacterium aquae]